MKNYLIIDAYNFAFRAYYAFPARINKKNQDIGCLIGFLRMICKVIAYHKNPNVLLVFDTGRDNFRKKIFGNYKSHRPKIDPVLKAQLPCLRYLCNELSIAFDEKDGYEADDLIASYAKYFSSNDVAVDVVSVDKDLIQILSNNVRIFNPNKWLFIEESHVLEDFGVYPHQFTNLQAIIGDPADNIPGIKGVGIKTASPIVNKHHHLEGVFENIDSLAISKRYKNLLLDNKDNAFLSRELVTLYSDLEVKEDIPTIDLQGLENRCMKIIKHIHEIDITTAI